LVSLLQGKLDSLVGKSSGYIENLPEEVKDQDILALEKKYLELYRPLYEKRLKVVRGECEPTKEEIEIGATLDEEQQTEIEENAQPEKNKVQENKESKKEPVKGIPEFWLTAMKNLGTIAEIITDRDEEALKHLIDIRMSYLEKPGFQLEFEFEENRFFKNKTLTKTYYYQDDPGYGGDFVYDHAEGTDIDWKEGEDLT
ncbi:18544_t:CDS:2, partial [Dentiscutata erythropus]